MMRGLVRRLWQDEHAVILSAELVIAGSVLVIGMTTGTTCLNEAVSCKMEDLAGAVGCLDQSYSFAGHARSGCAKACVTGSAYQNCEHEFNVNLSDTPAASAGLPVVSCGTDCLQSRCSSYGRSGCHLHSCGGWPGSIRIDTDVPRMKVTEWSSASGVFTEQHGAESFNRALIPPKRSYFNIPDSVW